MSPDPTENALADHLHRRSSRVVVPPDAAIVDRVMARSAVLGRRRRARHAALGSVAAVVAVAGAALILADDRSSAPARTSDDPAATAGQPSDPQAGAAASAPPPLPFDLLPPDDEQVATRIQAEDALVAACLADAGFGDRPYPRADAPTARTDAMIVEDFGVFDEAGVRERGYRPLRWDIESQLRTDDAAATGDPTFTEQYGADLLAAWAACQTGASEHLRGGPQDMASPAHPVNATGELQAEARRRAREDERIGAAVAGWSACMAGRGYDLVHPLDPVRAFAPGAPAAAEPPAPSEDEVATGLADVACKVEVAFAPTWYAVLAEHEQAVLDTHPAEIEAAASWHAEVDARALAVLADAAAPATP